MSGLPLAGRVAVVTGANQGIGAATAVELARLGADVAIAYLSYRPDDHDPGRPEDYATQREQGPDSVIEAIASLGRRSHSIEADLREPQAPTRIFAEAVSALGPVSILVNNASAWRKDTFSAAETGPLGRYPVTLTADTALPQLLVDARAGALMIANSPSRFAAIILVGGASSASRRVGPWVSRAKSPTVQRKRRSRTTP